MAHRLIIGPTVEDLSRIAERDYYGDEVDLDFIKNSVKPSDDICVRPNLITEISAAISVANCLQPIVLNSLKGGEPEKLVKRIT